ncbi:unnamed protein product [Blepharisma stoltei]|uniref:Uncharacterized protein n=1 Tax=Blepharisma stoltei TaxID=1481888 RepID=A0AAU9IJC3_9CILI|nr:unnamed protein product [Blepharisma stoltei]
MIKDCNSSNILEFQSNNIVEIIEILFEHTKKKQILYEALLKEKHDKANSLPEKSNGNSNNYSTKPKSILKKNFDDSKIDKNIYEGIEMECSSCSCKTIRIIITQKENLLDQSKEKKKGNQQNTHTKKCIYSANKMQNYAKIDNETDFLKLNLDDSHLVSKSPKIHQQPKSERRDSKIKARNIKGSIKGTNEKKIKKRRNSQSPKLKEIDKNLIDIEKMKEKLDLSNCSYEKISSHSPLLHRFSSPSGSQKCLTERHLLREMDRKSNAKIFEPILSGRLNNSWKTNKSIDDPRLHTPSPKFRSLSNQEANNIMESKIKNKILEKELSQSPNLSKFISPYSKVCFDLDKIKSHDSREPTQKIIENPDFSENSATSPSSSEFEAQNKIIKPQHIASLGCKQARQPSFGCLCEDFLKIESPNVQSSIETENQERKMQNQEISTEIDEKFSINDKLRELSILLSDEKTIKGLRFLGNNPQYFEVQNIGKILSLIK